MHSRLKSWKGISLYPISKHWHWEKSGTGLALYYRGLPRRLLNSYRSKVFQILLRLRPREAIPHSQYPGRHRCRASFFSCFCFHTVSIGHTVWKEDKTEERKTDRGKEHPVERLVPRNGGEQPGTSPTAMSETHSIADSHADPISIHGGSVDRVKEDKAGQGRERLIAITGPTE